PPRPGARIRYRNLMDGGQLSDPASTRVISDDDAGRADGGSRPRVWHGDQARLVFSSFLVLFVGLALIRWITANNVYVTEGTNFVLLASFLGIGIGFLNARSSRDYLRWAPLALLMLVAFVLAFPVVLHARTGASQFLGAGQARALPQPVSFGLIFLLTVAVMAGLGQAVARIFVRFPPLSAYRLGIARSLARVTPFPPLALLPPPPPGLG